MTPIRWILATIALALVVCLIVWARGLEHHRGDEVGALETTGTVAGP
jgi:hypothetical protein